MSENVSALQEPAGELCVMRQFRFSSGFGLSKHGMHTTIHHSALPIFWNVLRQGFAPQICILWRTRAITRRQNQNPLVIKILITKIKKKIKCNIVFNIINRLWNLKRTQEVARGLGSPCHYLVTDLWRILFVYCTLPPLKVFPILL